jgi:hypothetical protein
MHLRSIPIVAALLVAGIRAGAQDVRIEVFEAGTGKPIVGANVSLYDSAGTIPFGGGFSDQGGRTDLRGPGRGAYRLKADKVGYDTWTSVQLQLGEKAVLVRAAMAPSRTPAPIVARSETACQQLTTGPGSAAGDLWIEIKKALTASAMTEAQGLVPLDVDVYERVLDRNLGIVAEHVEQRPRIGRRPALGISWDQVDSTRRGDGAGSDVYRTPDAATLLSDQFVKSHCYAAIRGYGPETGLAGLEFKPARAGGLPEITGVLWLDPRDNTLRSLNFDYVNLPIPLRVARTSGRVEFQQLPNGQWIVPRWYIRMPRVGRVTSSDPRSPSRDSLLGYQEVGGAARPAGSAPRARNASAEADENLTADSPAENQSVIVGVVFDSTNSSALRDVQVSARGRYRTLTNAGGRYELTIDGPVNDTLVFEHPRLRLFRVAERAQVISLPAGARGQASVLIPSYATLRARLCGRNEMGTEPQGLMAGYVTDASGKPIAGAHVWASWQITWIEQGGRLVSTNQQRTVETNTNSDGSYLMCGLTRGAQITAKVGLAGRSTLEDRLVVPPTLVVEHDFRFGTR